MSNPFLLLHNLNYHSYKLLNLLENFPEDNNPKEKLRQLIRKSYIISVLSDKYVIAVAGLQGVGKSTFIKNFYEIDNDVLIANQGQGETLPILLTETKAQIRKAYVHKVVSDKYEHKTEREVITLSQFREKSHRFNASELMLELEVPEKVFGGTNKHFLLLPGFQKEDDYLKSLTYSALKASSTCIIVFFKTRYADVQNQKLIDELVKEFNQAKPLFILTWSDINPDVEFRNKVINDLQIPEQECDRVIITGDPGPTGWRNNVITALNRYTAPNKDFLAVQFRNLRTLNEEFNKLQVQIESFIDKQDKRCQNDEHIKISRILKSFEEKKKEISRDLKASLSKRYNNYFAKCIREVRNRLGEESFFKKFRDFFRNSIQVQNEFIELIENSINNANSTSIDEEFIYSLNSLQNKYLKEFHLTTGLLPDDESLDRKLILAGNPNGSDEDFDTSFKTDLIILCNQEKAKDLTTGFSEKLEYSVKLLPVLAMEGLRVGSIIPSMFKYNAIDLFKGDEENKDLLKIYQQNKKEVTIGLAILFGMDVIPDGELDIFGLLQQNHAAGSAAMAGLTVNWVLASIVTASALLYMVSQINKSLLDQQHSAEIAIESMKEYCISEYMDKYEQHMTKMQEIIREILRQRYGMHENYAIIQNIYDSTHAVENILKDIRREINESCRQMGWNI